MAMRADQILSLGTLFKGEVDKSFEQAVKRLRTILTGLANEQTKSARASRSGLEGGRMTLYQEQSEYSKILGRFKDETGEFQAAMNTLLKGLTPEQMKGVAAQIQRAERVIGTTTTKMNQNARDTGTAWQEGINRTAVALGLLKNKLGIVNGEFVAHDEIGRQILQRYGIQDRVSAAYNKTLREQVAATKDLRVQNKQWLNQFSASPPMYKAAEKALKQVDAAAGQMGASMVAAGKGGGIIYDNLSKASTRAAIAQQVLQRNVQISGNKFLAANEAGDKFLQNLNLGGNYTTAFAAKLRELGGSSDWVGKQIGRVRGGIERLAAAFKVTASYAVAGGFMYMIGQGASQAKQAIYEFDQGLANLKAITGATEAEARAMGKAIISVAKETKYSTTEVADAMTILGQAGLTAGESVDAIRATALLATGTLEKMEVTADLLTTTLASFNLKASESGRVADVMAKAINDSKLTVDKLRTAFNYIAPVAHTAGLSLEDTTAAMEVLANAGLKGSTIGTSFRQVLQRLVAPTAEMRAAFTAAGADFTKLNPRTASMAEIFDELGKVVPNAQRAFELFGVRAAPAVSAFVTAGREGFEQFLNALYKAGSAEEMAAKQMKGLQAQASQLANRLRILAIEVGKGGLASAFDTLYSAIRPVVDLMIQVASSTAGQALIGITGLTTAVLGLAYAFKFLKVVGLAVLVPDKTISDIKKMIVTGNQLQGVWHYVGIRMRALWGIMLAHPILAIIGAFIALGIALKTWYDSMKRSQEILEEQEITLKKQQDSLASYKEKLTDTKNNQIAFSGTIQRLIKDFPELTEEIEKCEGSYDKLVKVIEKHQSLKLWETIKNEAEQIDKLQEIAGRGAWIDVLTQRLMRLPQTINETMWQIAKNTWIISGKIGDGMVKELAPIFKATPLGRMFLQAVEEAKPAIESAVEGLGNIISDGFEKLPLTQEVREKMKKAGADVKKQAAALSEQLQSEEIGFTKETSVEDIAKKLEDKLQITADKAIKLAQIVKANWSDIPFKAKTFAPVDYEALLPFERLNKQRELLKQMGPEWMQYFHQIDAGMSESARNFAAKSNAKLVEAALAAKKETDKMEDDAKNHNLTIDQVEEERLDIQRKHLQSFIDIVDKYRKAGEYRQLKPEDYLPIMPKKAPFTEWAKQSFDIDVNTLGDELQERLYAIYQRGYKLVKLRDLPKDVQRETQKIFKNALTGESWVWPDIFKGQAEQWVKSAKTEMPKASDEIEAVFKEAAERYQLDVDLIRSVAYQESRFNPKATSPVGAKGIMQLMEGTAKDMGVENIYDIRENVMGGAKYLSQLIKDYQGEVDRALIAYNQGPASLKNKGAFKSSTKYKDEILARIGMSKKDLSKLEGTDIPMTKFLGHFQDSVDMLETEGERLRRIEMAPTSDPKKWWAEHDAQLAKSQKDNEATMKWLQLDLQEGLGNYGKLWDKFTRERISRIVDTSPMLNDVLKESYDIDLPKMQEIMGDITSPEDWNRQRAAILSTIDPIKLYEKVLEKGGNNATEIQETILAVFEELKKEFPEQIENWNKLEEATRASWAATRDAFHDDAIAVSLKKSADSVNYYFARIKGAFNEGIFTAEEYARKVEEAYASGQLSYEEYVREMVAATQDGFTNFKLGLGEARNNIESFGRMWQKFGEEVIGVLADNFTEAIESIVDGSKTAKDAFIDMAKSIMSWASKLLMQAALQRLFSAIMPSGYNPAGTSAPILGMLTSSREAHTGGVMGKDVFPTRFHAGGANLAANEIPAILKKNETVFTPGQMQVLGKAMGAGGGATTSINIPINVSGVGGDTGRLTNRLRGNIEEVVRKTLREEMR